jgi:hypothetical protein
MNMRLRRKSITGPAALTLAGVTLVVCSAKAQDDWTKRFRIGVSVGFNINAEFSTGGAFAVPGGGTGNPNDLNYDNGYVRLDDTGNAQGLTSYWGYEDASQYDPSANTLTYQGTTAFASQQGMASEDDSPFIGFDMAYGTRLTDWGDTAIGWELGFTLLPIKIQNTSSSPVFGKRSTYSFDTGGIIMPQAPYNGGASGTGPLINATPTEGPAEISAGTLNDSRELSSMLYNIRLGANARWHLTGRWSVGAGLGFSTGIVTSDYSFNENIVYDSGGTLNYSGSYRSTDFVFGGYGEAMIYWQAEKSGELYLGGQYIGMTNVNLDGQGRQATLDLNGGIYLTAGIHWAF